MIGIYTEKVGGVWFGVAFEGRSIYATSFASSEKDVLRGLRESIPSRVPLAPLQKTEFARRVVAMLKDIYDGKEVSQEFSLATRCLSKYAEKVLEAICKVPPGYVTSYGEIAKAVGGAPRAVGQVMASNPFAPICPCHRVVKSDFTLGGYGGGLSVKLEFLRREGRGYPSKREIPVNGKSLQVYPVEFVLQRLEACKRSTHSKQKQII